MKFTITQLLYAMVVMAFIAAILGAGANGSPLAYGIGVSLCSLVIYFLFFALFYWFANYLSFRRTGATGKAVKPPKPHLESPQESDA